MDIKSGHGASRQIECWQSARVADYTTIIVSEESELRGVTPNPIQSNPGVCVAINKSGSSSEVVFMCPPLHSEEITRNNKIRCF